jgi:hypothetical protein
VGTSGKPCPSEMAALAKPTGARPPQEASPFAAPLYRSGSPPAAATCTRQAGTDDRPVSLVGAFVHRHAEVEIPFPRTYVLVPAFGSPRPSQARFAALHAATACELKLYGRGRAAVIFCWAPRLPAGGDVRGGPRLSRPDGRGSSCSIRNPSPEGGNGFFYSIWPNNVCLYNLLSYYLAQLYILYFSFSMHLHVNRLTRHTACT